MPAGVSVRKDGDDVMAILDAVKDRGKTAQEALLLAKELKSPMAGG